MNRLGGNHLYDGKKLGFFFGAGASAEFGIPTLKALTKEFHDMIQSNDTKERRLFNQIYESMETIYGKDSVDVESIISVIVGLKDESKVKENIGDLGLFLLNNSEHDIYMPLKVYDNQTLSNLEKIYKNFIRDKVVLKTEGIDSLIKVYENFFQQVCSIVNCTNHRKASTTDPYENTFAGWVFFTTNYDNAIEEYWINYRKHTTLDLGFKQIGTKYPLMDADRFVQTNLSTVDDPMQLVKLHGSANWIRNRQGQIEEREYNQSMNQIRSRTASGEVEDDLMVYPLTQKELYFPPYIQFFRILESELKKRKIWIIIGYSFRDIIVRTMFEKALRTGKHKIILVHPLSSDIRELFHVDIQQHISDISEYFARSDYNQVNQKITQTAEMLLSKDSV